MKRIVWCVAVMMLLVCVGAWALAEEEVYSYLDYDYVLLEDSSAKIVKYNDDSLYRNGIDEEVDGYPVTAIASFAFRGWRKSPAWPSRTASPRLRAIRFHGVGTCKPSKCPPTIRRWR